MIKEFDGREPADRIEPARQYELSDQAASLSDDLPGDHRVTVVSYDRETGNAAVVVSEDNESIDGQFVSRALDHVQRISPALGLAPGQPPEFRADPSAQQTSSGAVVVHLTQQYKGIGIYEAAEAVRFAPGGRLTEVAGRSHTVVGDIPVDPSVTPAEALVSAAEYVTQPVDDPPLDPFGQSLAPPELDLTGFDPRPLLAQVDQPERPTTFDAPPFVGPCVVQLVWFPIDGGLRLAWHIVLAFPNGPQFRVIVDAADRRVLLVKQLARSIVGSADVFLPTPEQTRRRVSIPMPLDGYGLDVPDDLPDGFPYPWLVDETTVGSNVQAIVIPGSQPASGQVIDGEAVLSDPDPNGVSQLIVNLFVANGMMHDALYLLGFREDDGNFQTADVGSGGVAGDRVVARVHPGPVWGTANMATPVDGSRPEMNMGLVEHTGRHTALDTDVVIHEYCHGLTNRLVGGPMNVSALDAVQSGGMGEGWGDYFACIINNRLTVGAWVVDHPTGIRRHRYDEHYPGTFADLGTAAYSGVHDIGELWCAALMDLNRRIGTAVAAQLVVDALKLAAANPGLLAMRDAILVAARDHAISRELTAADGAELTRLIWHTFADFGMGPGAASIEATLGGVVADFTRPSIPVPGTRVSAGASPALAIPDNDSSGVVSEVELVGPGTVADIEISVEISHSYRGDLTVDLRSPAGTVVRLHNRAGGGQADLVATWTIGELRSLEAFVGQPVAGSWTLEVADRAGLDVGRLDAWQVDVGLGTTRSVVERSASPALVVPDDDPTGISSVIDLDTDGTVARLEVDIDITHTWIGDLVVVLTGPTGQSSVLHDRAGEGADNLIVGLSSGDGGPLDDFIGLSAGGDWTLAVSDHAGRDVGKLNHWTVRAEL